MSELPFQNALAKLLTDERTRQAVFTGDVRPLTELGCSAEQVERLLEIDCERVEIFAEMLIGNIISKAAQGLPWTTTLLGSRMRQIASEFNRSVLRKSARNYHEIMGFAQYLKQQIASQPFIPAFLEDVLVYEMNCLELRYEFNGLYEPKLSPKLGAKLRLLKDDRSLSEIIPCRLLHNRVLTLSYDVESVGEEISQGRIPATTEKRSTHVLLHVTPSGAVAQIVINLPTRTFLAACDGKASLREIIKHIARDFHQKNPKQFLAFKYNCLELCRLLVRRHVISLKLR